MKMKNSRELLERAFKVIPSATQTFSKGPNQWPGNVSPNFIKRGEGAWVWDVDGNRYLDYLMALGPIVLGYGNERVNNAILAQVNDGAVFSQMHPLEVEVAELLVELIPCAEMVRFAKNGSDATTGAVRAARAYTGRDRIAYCGYHGWHDWYIGTTTRDKGVPQAVKELSHSFSYNDISSLEQLLDSYSGEFAAVVMEPVGVEMPDDGYLETVKLTCEKHGALLVFDEIVTGFRFSLGGAQEYFGVTPDIACFGKAIANGLPLSAIVGRREVMNEFDEIFFSGTFGGEAVSLAAAKATIEEIRDRDIIKHIWDYGTRLSDAINTSLKKHSLSDDVKLFGLPPRTVIAFPGVDESEMYARRSYVMQECIKQNILYFCSHLPCGAHGEEEFDLTVTVLDKAFKGFADAINGDGVRSLLEGDAVSAIFRKP